MTSTRRTPASFAHTTVNLGDCRSCGKQILLSRKSARQVAKKLQASDPRPRAYRCPVNPQHWHVGHVPGAVRKGVLTRADWDRKRGRS